jgi:AraC-like DNA-binding protein
LPFDLVRYAPASDLVDFVEHYWVATWNLGCTRHDQEILASGTVAAVVDSGPFAKSGVTGPVTGVFVRTLTGCGRAFGVKFRPAGIRAFSPRPVSELTDHRLPFVQVFGPAGVHYEREQLAEPGHAGLVARANGFLIDQAPVLEQPALLARQAYERVGDPEIRTTSALAKSMQMSERRIQRVFKEYVGVTPKWAIKRFRFQAALQQVQSGQRVDFTQLAMSLGYFDQAHFNHEFRATMGCTPTSFARQTKSTDGIDA